MGFWPLRVGDILGRERHIRLFGESWNWLGQRRWVFSMRLTMLLILLALSGCSSESGFSGFSFAPSNGETLTNEVSNPEGEASLDPGLDGSFAPVIETLPATISHVPSGGSGSWGDAVFHVTEAYTSATSEICRKVSIQYVENSLPEDRLVCGAGASARFVASVF